MAKCLGRQATRALSPLPCRTRREDWSALRSFGVRPRASLTRNCALQRMTIRARFRIPVGARRLKNSVHTCALGSTRTDIQSPHTRVSAGPTIACFGPRSCGWKFIHTLSVMRFLRLPSPNASAQAGLLRDAERSRCGNSGQISQYWGSLRMSARCKRPPGGSLDGWGFGYVSLAPNDPDDVDGAIGGSLQ